LTFTPAQPLVGLPVTFTITPSAGNNSNLIQSATLDFGDGRPAATLGAINAAQSVQHVYERADSYTATLTLVDSAGLRSVTSTIVTVARPVVGVTIQPSAASGQVGTALTFTVTVTNNSSVAIQSVTVSFGDGTSTTLGPTGGSVPKVYTTPGTFSVRATATDQSGNRYEGTTSVIILGATPLDVTLDAISGDANVVLTCTPLTGYPKSCVAQLPLFGLQPQVRIVLSVGCASGIGSAPSQNALSYFWTYGDGATETTSQRNVDHVYLRGNYEINVEVRTSTGSTGFQRLRLLVQ
jgi:PKD repeat protein